MVVQVNNSLLPTFLVLMTLDVHCDRILTAISLREVTKDWQTITADLPTRLVIDMVVEHVIRILTRKALPEVIVVDVEHERAILFATALVVASVDVQVRRIFLLIDLANVTEVMHVMAIVAKRDLVEVTMVVVVLVILILLDTAISLDVVVVQVIKMVFR